MMLKQFLSTTAVALLLVTGACDNQDTAENDTQDTDVSTVEPEADVGAVENDTADALDATVEETQDTAESGANAVEGAAEDVTDEAAETTGAITEGAAEDTGAAPEESDESAANVEVLTEMTGIISEIDPEAHTLILEDGSEFTLQDGVSTEGLEPGAEVTLLYEDQGGERVATEVRPAE